MRRPQIPCPACLEVYHKVSSDEYVSICSIVYAQYEQGASNFPNYTVEVNHCKNYEKCVVWREDKEKNWMIEYAKKYGSLEKGEKLWL